MVFSTQHSVGSCFTHKQVMLIVSHIYHKYQIIGVAFCVSAAMNILSIFSLILLSLYTLSLRVESSEISATSCNDDTKTNPTISRNIDSLLPKLVSGTIRHGFVAASHGQDGYKVYGVAQCRGDVNSSDCASCIKDAAKEIKPACPSQSDARIWYDYCFLRYSTGNFLGEVDTSGVYFYNVENVTEPGVFNKRLGSLMDEIRSEAVRPRSRGLGRGRRDLSDFVKLYALVQCMRDLSEMGCAQCLSIAVSNFPTFCGDKRGCRVLYSSCYVRYELYPFFFPLDSASSRFGEDDRVVAVRI
ncbi:cysteine-rich repeat secretory protein 55-like [Salvia hispanica]|uniref:cysteine-rich repeat secretory protein 55-like n=1 Tax=Salvia hispanica TaxID=49212 RepID=UPI0020097FA9|nr:cysteine-rich repeat secretory protein 55-like [Salvia hispanica]